MINAIVTFLCALFFLISGVFIQFLKRIVQIIITLLLKILNLIGIKVSKRESRLKVSKQFKNTFKDIKVVKKSNQNSNFKPSINAIALIGLVLSVALLVINLGPISQNAISKWLFDDCISNISLLNSLVTSQRDMDIMFTATLFSIISFSISKLLNQWKETAKQRKLKKKIKLQKTAIEVMTSKELLEAAKNKDNMAYNKIKGK